MNVIGVELFSIQLVDINGLGVEMNKFYNEMTDDELKLSFDEWEYHVKNAGGWSSAYFAAKQIEQIVFESDKRNLGLVNNFTIKKG